MDQSKPSFFITTPIYYVNADPHLGTAYSTIIADVQARYRRSAGYNVKFLTGMDEHGEKVAEAAAKHNMTPQEWTDSQAPHFKEQARDLQRRLHSHHRAAPASRRAVSVGAHEGVRLPV